MKINVLFFGACREAVNVGELSLDLTAPADVIAAFAQLKQQFPDLARYEPHALFAVNEDHVRRTHSLQDGDTLAIFPPVSGG